MARSLEFTAWTSCDGELNQLRGDATEVIGDGDGEKVITKKIGIGCVRPIARGRIDRGGAVFGLTRVCDGEDRSIGEPCRVFYFQSAFDGGVFCTCLGDITSDEGRIIGASDVDGVGDGGGIAVVCCVECEGIGDGLTVSESFYHRGVWCVGVSASGGTEGERALVASECGNAIGVRSGECA